MTLERRFVAGSHYGSDGGSGHPTDPGLVIDAENVVYLVKEDGTRVALKDLGGGGGGVLTQTATLTTDPDTFVATHVFDLGHPTVVYWHATLLSYDADGETWGSSPGQILIDIYSISQSRDGATFYTPSGGGFMSDQQGPVGFAFDGVVAVARYLSVNQLRIIDGSSFNVYAGTHHPGATVRFDVEYE